MNTFFSSCRTTHTLLVHCHQNIRPFWRLQVDISFLAKKSSEQMYFCCAQMALEVVIFPVCHCTHALHVVVFDCAEREYIQLEDFKFFMLRFGPFPKLLMKVRYRCSLGRLQYYRRVYSQKCLCKHWVRVWVRFKMFHHETVTTVLVEVQSFQSMRQNFSNNSLVIKLGLEPILVLFFEQNFLR